MSSDTDLRATTLANRTGPAATERDNRARMRRLVSEAGLIGVTILVFLALYAAAPTFRSTDNLINILQQNAIFGVVACGMLVMIISGGFDLSVGATGAAASVATAHLSSAGWPVWECLAAAIVIGVVVGAANGAIIAYLRINAFVATLGMNSVVVGLLFVATNARPSYAKPGQLFWLGLNRTYGIPNAFIVLLVCALLTWFLLTRTRFGHYVFSVGGNEYASMLSGVNVARTKLVVFIYGGLMAGVAGLLLIGQTGLGQPASATNWPLTAIAICVVGGAALSGGQGRTRDVLIATLLLGMIANGLNQLNVSAYWQPAVTGAVILGAVLLDRRKR
jgi:ribose/xylose/arabinose/galactoside ABC-type transport system permease subunit